MLALLLASAGCRAPVEQPQPPPEPIVAIGSPILPLLLLDLQQPLRTGQDEARGVLKVVEDHDGSLQGLSSRPVAAESAVAVELQGDTSLNLPKKSYQLELIDDRQDERGISLLGLPPHSDWVLHSCGFDPVCLRNVLAYTLASQFGRYAPRTRFAELFVNGEYQGLYVLVERIRRGRDRVDLPRPAASAAGGDVTGGHIFRMDLGEGGPDDRRPRDWVSPASSLVYSYYYPRHDDITSEQQAYLRDHVARFETMMRGERWDDPDAGYRRWLDVPSWIDFALLQEVSMNPDAYHKSVYLQKWPHTRGNKIAIGPVWDFDLAFGAVEFRDARNPRVWAHAMNRYGGEPVPYDPPGRVPYVAQFWERLWSDPAFHRDLQCRWLALRGDILRTDRLEATIDGWFTQISSALARDAARWPALPKSHYLGGIVLLKQILRERLAWMDANLPGTCAAPAGP